VAGTLAAIVKAWVAFSRFPLTFWAIPWIPIVEAVLGTVLAMVGPGVWSIDATALRRKASIFPEPLVEFSPPKVVVPQVASSSEPTGRPFGVVRKPSRVPQLAAETKDRKAQGTKGVKKWLQTQLGR